MHSMNLREISFFCSVHMHLVPCRVIRMLQNYMSLIIRLEEDTFEMIFFEILLRLDFKGTNEG